MRFMLVYEVYVGLCWFMLVYVGLLYSQREESVQKTGSIKSSKLLYKPASSEHAPPNFRAPQLLLKIRKAQVF
jgi:hypothetical protein